MPPGSREELPEDKLVKVLDVAAELALDGGLEAMRMREIATGAGIALATLYKYFGSKDEVIIGLLERELDLLERSLPLLRTSGDTYVKRAMSFFDPVTRILHSRAGYSRALLIAVATANHELAGRVGRYHERITALISQVLRGADPPRGESRALADAEIDKLAYMLSQTWFAALIGSLSNLFTIDQSIERVGAAAIWLVRGALTD
jgi:AcrR family transcriptional regulator